MSESIRISKDVVFNVDNVEFKMAAGANTATQTASDANLDDYDEIFTAAKNKHLYRSSRQSLFIHDWNYKSNERIEFEGAKVIECRISPRIETPEDKNILQDQHPFYKKMDFIEVSKFHHTYQIFKTAENNWLLYTEYYFKNKYGAITETKCAVCSDAAELLEKMSDSSNDNTLNLVIFNVLALRSNL